MEKIAFIIYLGSIVFGVLLFGAAHTWVYTVVFLGVMAASLMLLKDDVIRQKNEWHLRWVKTDLSPLFFAFIAYIIIQMLPLPESLIGLVSPAAKIDGDMSSSAAALHLANPQGSWYALAPYIYPVRMSLIRWVVYGFLFFGLTRCLNSRERIETAIITVLLLGCFDALYGMMQTYSGYNHIWWFKKEAYVRDVSGTYVNRNHFAGFMEMGITLAVAYAAALTGRDEENPSITQRRRTLGKRLIEFFSRDKKAHVSLLIAFIGGVMGYSLILSASRGGIIGAACSLLLLGLFFSFRKSERRKRWVIQAIFGIAVIYGLYAGLDYAVERFDYFYESMQNRILMAENAFAIFKEYPTTGIGLGNFPHASGRYQDDSLRGSYIDFAHNDYAQFLAEAGIAGAIILLIGLCWYIFRTFRLWRERSDPFAVCLGSAPFGALLAIAIHSWSDFNLHIPANVMLLIAVIAIGSASLRLEQRHDIRTPREYRLIPRRWPGLALNLSMAGLIIWSGIWSIRHLVAEAYCNTKTNITLNLEQNPAAASVRAAMRWDPGNAEYPNKLAQALMSKRDKLMSLSAPDLEGWKRSHGPIVAELERAIRLNPLNPNYHVRLAWECSYRWDQADYSARWMPAADISMNRAAYLAGNWALNPKLHYSMGNYWTMRARMFGADDPQSEIAWKKAVRHYRKGMELENIRELPKDVQGYIHNFFTDRAHLDALKK